MLYLVGIGPGAKSSMTQAALRAIKEAEVIVGYSTYIHLVSEMLADKKVIQTGMHGEISRCQKALELAQKYPKIVLICSGDAGIYGMAGLIFELEAKEKTKTKIKIIPGVTASIGTAAKLGAPLMNDFCQISLSDLMTPWKVIEKRLEAAAWADFVICLYNPRSKSRPNNLHKALDIILQYKPKRTLVGIGKNIGRKNEINKITTIGSLDEKEIDMRTTVIIGNKNTYCYDKKMITPRGYKL